MNTATPTKKRWRLLRPFPDAHWLLPVGMLVYFQIIYIGRWCNKGPYYLEAAGVVGLIALCLWQADRACGEARGWRLTFRVVYLCVRDLTSFVTLLVLTAIPATIVMPHYYCYSERAYVSEFLLYTSEAQHDIADKAEAARSLANAGTGVNLSFPKEKAVGLVHKDGVIVVVSHKPSVAFVLSPSLDSGKVTWTCQGVPVRSMPAPCRP